MAQLVSSLSSTTFSAKKVGAQLGCLEVLESPQALIYCSYLILMSNSTEEFCFLSD